MARGLAGKALQGHTLPSPLAGEGGPRSGSGEGSKIASTSSAAAFTRRAPSTPHPSASPTPSPARGEGRSKSNRHIPRHRGAVHQAQVAVVAAFGQVHGAAVVPHQQHV